MVDLPDLNLVEDWLRSQTGFEQAIVNSAVLAEGGASNVTCRIEVGGAIYPAIALRLERADGIFAPYDVVLEGQVIERLGPSEVPVPVMIGSEDDTDILGARFIAMEWIDAPHMGIAGEQADYGAFVNAVSTVHGVPWRELGLSILGVPADERAASRAHLHRMAERMAGFDCDGDPLLTRALSRLDESIPACQDPAFCQGDINVFNYLFRDRRVIGVVDWEEAFIGDVRCDVGQLVALSHLKGEPWTEADQTGFARAYAEASGKTLHDLVWFRALWFFHLAVIWRGWVKYSGGVPWYSREDVSSALERALSEI